ncbi:hypothetical protein IWQ62_005095 [Dispira parvispora]|uniref:Glycine zipper 2TM domain-containing protein n=1 Tax=Dispira parvispora TaxID=1520584 RepID=A0A9W8AKN1_9FUNG|nr:hypothetical protein IWQ62_005095 [Dispira parvispora]
MFKSALIIATFALASVASATQSMSYTRAPPSNRLAKREFKDYVPGIVGGAAGTYVGDKLFKNQQGLTKTAGVAATALGGSVLANYLYKKRQQSKGGNSNGQALPGAQGSIGL